MGKGLSWCANDYFIFKEVTVIMLFYYMTKKTMNNSVVNRLASYVPFVYMGEESVRRVLFYYTDFSWMYDKCGLIFVVILLSTLISLLVGVVELIRRFVFGFFENRYVNLKKLVFFKIKSISGIILDRICYH
jgi:hypothetical protein